ncbi:WbqC family protein [Bosea sp. BK604]|uniref:WbqC family protein n=1 Tax=Bosea sp. BK604 TaxID=2512180 RepID=UPI0010458598|nr:WbqC family protein [Bosea sp. BK604]TCR70003.1 WbqC-like protein [Bosea sp. BK604]
MILVTIQPSFLPWLGYLEQMALADIFVYLDDVKYTGQDWRNRNRVLDATGKPEYLTVPVRAQAEKLPIKDVRISDDPRWARKIINKLKPWYARAPHTKRYLPRLQAILEGGHELLVDLNYEIMAMLVEAYDIRTPVTRSSEAGIVSTDKNQRLIDLCLHHGATVLYDGAVAADFIDIERFRAAGIEVVFQNYRPQPYDQGGHAFVSHLSSLDTLLWCGDAARDILRASPVPDALPAKGKRA